MHSLCVDTDHADRHSPSWQTRAKFIYKATKQHALNLAKFVTIYKTALLLQRNLLHGNKKQGSLDTFFAGLIGGYTVFGDRNAVNEQVRASPLRIACTAQCRNVDCPLRSLESCDIRIATLQI